MKGEIIVMVEYATVTGGSLNLRKEKSTNSDKLTSMPNGTQVAVVEHEDDWCKVIYNQYTDIPNKSRLKSAFL